VAVCDEDEELEPKTKLRRPKLLMKTIILTCSYIAMACHGMTQQAASRKNVLFLDDLRPAAILGERISPPDFLGDDGDTELNSLLNQRLSDLFSKYGPLEKLEVHGIPEFLLPRRKQRRKRRPYAFVTYTTDESAELAINGNLSHSPPLFRKVCLSKVPDTWRKKPLRSPREKSDVAQQTKVPIADLISSGKMKVDIVLQVNKSHLYRVVDYINNELSSGPIVISGYQTSTSNIKLSLVFLEVQQSSNNQQETILTFLEKSLTDNPFIHKGLNKAYVVHRQKDVSDAFQSEDEICVTACQMLEDNNKLTAPRMKVQAFPPKTQSTILECLDQQDEIEITPSGHSHVLSVVCLDSPQTSHKTLLWGISKAWNATIGDGHSSSRLVSWDGEDGEVSRAYYKLLEAFERSISPKIYKTMIRPTEKPLMGIDCGAAPGGWTKYLIQDFGCSTVYSVDPGKLDPSVEMLEGVQHLPVKAETAIQTLAKERVCLDVWVSDMCLHDMNQQVDILLDAIQAGILRSKSIFCLTLKCTIGHSKSSHDSQVAQAVQRLNGVASETTVLHLFSNRKGERTVVGLIQ
jgi:23S rRNA U2552 (ribose-2'-O)-methylase RlmE/FtsJ